MIHDLKPYPAYKDSGVPWAGRIPAHWAMLRGKALFSESQLPIRDSDEIVTCFRDGQVTLRRNRRASGFMVALKEAGYQGVRKGQLVIHAMDAFAGAVGVSDSDGKCTPEYIVCDPRRAEAEPGYFAYILRVAAHSKFIEVACPAVRERAPRLRYPDFGTLQLPVPTAREQVGILRYLTHANRRIQRYIRAKKKLITLLNEQKQAIIHHAVTRGLDPGVRLKPSGVEWLGEVPEHWEVKRFKFLVRISSGQVDPREPEQKCKVLIAPNHIKSGSGRVSYFETAEEQGADSGKYEANQGQVIYSKIRPALRKAAIAPMDCLCSADMYPLVARRSELMPEFFLKLLLSAPFTRYATDCSLRVAMPKINREALGEAWLWYPDLDEQDGILSYIKSSTASLDRALDYVDREVKFLLEYRVRLIADMVTGKLDVREAAARLPEEIEDLEPLDEGEALAEEDGEGAEGEDSSEEAVA